MSRTQIRDFTHGNIPTQLITFAWPLFLSNLLQVVYNMVDMIVVGKVLGKAGLSAVAIGGDVSHFLTFVSMGFANAGQVIIARYIGAMRIVEAIQYCVDLDIPLKQFTDFLKETDEEIDYAKLIDYGTAVTKQKMQQIQNKLNFLENAKSEIAHAEECLKQSFTKKYHSQKICWTVPFDGTQTSPNFHSAIYKLISEIESNGLKAGYNNGQLITYSNERTCSYLFIDIRETNKNLDEYPQIMRMPEGEYLSVVSKESKAAKAPEVFKEQFSEDYDKVVIEVELFAGSYHYSEPIYELRCLLPATKGF